MCVSSSSAGMLFVDQLIALGGGWQAKVVPEVELLAFEDGAFYFRGIGDCFPDEGFFWIVRFVDWNFDHRDPAGGFWFVAWESSKHFLGVLSSFDSLESFFFSGIRFCEGDSGGRVFLLCFAEIEGDSREGAYFALGCA